MNQATWLARAILSDLVQLGMREVVVCPGSRSAPLAHAALDLDQAGLLRMHVRLDERSAGFLALGLAKASGEPVAVICTSGSAVANLSPAFVEAAYSGVPLVALTADRPVEMRGVGAPQTIDQVDFFGADARSCVDLGADLGIGGLGTAHREAVRAGVAGAVAASLGVCKAVSSPPGHVVSPGSDRAGRVGPVHINVGLREPLLPDEPWSADALAVPGRSPQPRGLGPSASARRALSEFLGEVPERGVLVAGDLPPGAIGGPQQWLAELASACGWPIIGEPSANLQGAPTALCHAVPILQASDFLSRHRPDLVLTVGRFGLSRPTMSLVRGAARHVALDLPGCGRNVCDPMRTASVVLDQVPKPPTGFRSDPGWLAGWQAADQAVAEALAAADARPRPVAVGAPSHHRAGGPAGHFTGIDAARAVVAQMAEGELLFVAASWPVRHVESFCAVPPGVTVMGNRGTNGIDGLVATSWGAALAHQARGGGRAVALLGDLAFLHDHNGLLAAARDPAPDLVLVVVDNGGGGIFHQLEQGRAEHSAAFERLYGTPHGLELLDVARAAGRAARQAADASQLREALDGDQTGVRVVIVRVAHRSAEAEHLVGLREACAGTVDALS